MGFCFFWTSKETNPNHIDNLPAHRRGGLLSFVLKQKATKIQERTKLPPPRAKHLARRSFIPAHGYCASFCILSFILKLFYPAFN